MNCPHCEKPIKDKLILSAAGQIQAGKRVKPTGGARKGAGRPIKLIDCPRGCGFQAGVRAMGKHRCEPPTIQID